MKWFTADLHFGHRGIIGLCRPWARDVDHMNETLIAAVNHVVAPTDELYILGDLSFANREKTISYIGQLNGHIKVVPGNHDNPSYMKQMDAMGMITLLPPLCEVRDDGQAAVLCHFPLLSWNNMHHGSWNLHGHCHGNLKTPIGKQIDVGFDVWQGPVNWGLLVELMSRRPIASTDHHERLT